MPTWRKLPGPWSGWPPSWSPGPACGGFTTIATAAIVIPTPLCGTSCTPCRNPMLHTLTHDFGPSPRKSLLYMPETGATRMPLVVMLHGTGATASWTLEETRWQELADREGFL